MRNAFETVLETIEAHCPVCGEDRRHLQMSVDEIVLARRARVDWPIVRCAACQTVYVGKRLAGAAPQAAYHDHSYGFDRSRYADSLMDSPSHAGRVLDEIAKFQTPGDLLDVGCATGSFLKTAASRGWTVAGVEVSPHQAKVAQASGLDVFVGPLDDSPFAPQSFDVITLLDVIEHLDTPGAMMAKIHQLLRPGGILVVETPNWNSVYRRALGRWWAALQPRLHLIYFDLESLSRLLESHGFAPVLGKTEVVSLLSREGRSRGFGPSFITHWARQMIVRHRLSRPPSALDRRLLSLRDRSPEDASVAHEPGGAGSSEAPKWIRALNRPVDGFFNSRGMGEQLRIVARRT